MARVGFGPDVDGLIRRGRSVVITPRPGLPISPSRREISRGIAKVNQLGSATTDSDLQSSDQYSALRGWST
jgi:hypothetical protein